PGSEEVSQPAGRRDHHTDVKKSIARAPLACARRNSVHVGPERCGAGPIRLWRRIVRIAVAETRTPSLESSPLIRMHPHREFSRAMRRINSRTPSEIGG